MIFNVPGHIMYIRNGLTSLPADNLNLPIELRIVKTETRRLKRGIYQVGKDYAVQRKRGVKGEPDIRIVIDRIWEEHPIGSFFSANGGSFTVFHISEEHAWAEGGYVPAEFEDVFHKLNPKFSGWSRWAFKFHVIKAQT
ncbi:MAG: hypothetical protein WA977_08430 [Halobacteriota archaeon]